jgi:hypothetical protein
MYGHRHALNIQDHDYMEMERLMSNPGNEGQVHVHDHIHARRDEGPYWRRAHRDWRFWAGMVLMLAAIAMYVLSEDLSMIPRL